MGKTHKIGSGRKSKKSQKSSKISDKISDKPKDVNIGKTSFGGSSTIPNYKIVNGPTSASVNLSLRNGQTILAQSGAMSYMDDTFKVDTSMRGVMGGIKRLFTTTSSFINGYTAEKNKSKISFASFLPGDIVPIIIKPGQKITIASYGVVCMTENVKLNVRMRLKGVLLGENAFLTDAVVDKGSSPGMVWVSSYGGYEKLNVEAGSILKVDNGMFLAADSNVRFTISKVGGVKSLFFSGEGIVMKFEGPCSLLIQNRNINDFTKFIKGIVQTYSGKSKGLGGPVGAIFD